MRTVEVQRMRISALIFVCALAFSAMAYAGQEGLGWVSPVDEWRCPKTHPIKGNINKQKRSMIYHMPGGQYYLRTKPERCFATEKAAVRNGFRRSRR